MTSPSLELQGAVVARLASYPGLVELIGGRVYDRVPADATFPYVSIGADQMFSDDAECITGFEITFQIDAWSRAVGFPEVKRIAEQVRRALTDDDLELTDNAMLSLEHSQTRMMRDPDGLTNHAAIQFVAIIEQP